MVKIIFGCKTFICYLIFKIFVDRFMTWMKRSYFARGVSEQWYAKRQFPKDGVKNVALFDCCTSPCRRCAVGFC